MDKTLVWLHVSGNLVWIGSILAVGIVLGSDKADPKTRGRIALDVYRRIAVPALVLSLLGGAIRLACDAGTYLQGSHWMHAKLPPVIAVIALQHALGARAREMAASSQESGRGTRALVLALGVAAALATLFAVFKIPA
jgi:protoporphyrinogen IX oxidase